jgi:hypothetical protein
MRVVNETRYPTRVLRSILVAAHNDLARSPGHWWQRVVRVTYGRGGRRDPLAALIDEATGTPTGDPEHVRVYLHGHSDLVLCLPHGRVSIPHVGGAAQTGMRWAPADVRRYLVEPLPWLAERFGPVLDELPPVRKPAPTTAEKRQRRVEALAARRKRWASKARRAATAIRKIDAALRRLERLGVPGAAAAREG